MAALPTTFAHRVRHAEIWKAWDPLTGHWSSPADGDQAPSLVLCPRTNGALTGLLVLPRSRSVLFFDAGQRGRATVSGAAWTASKRLAKTPARLRCTGSSTGGRLVVDLGGTTYRLERTGDINDTLLSRVCIIGHRGLGFGGVDNTPKAIALSWYFGSSAVELDVLTPYEWTLDGNKFLWDRQVVYHPPTIAQTEEFRRIGKRYASLAATVQALKTNPCPLIYLDPKLGRFDLAGQRDVLTRAIGTVAGLGERVTVAAPTVEGARLLAGTKTTPSLLPAGSGLSWTLEWSEAKAAARYIESGAQAPAYVSFSLLRLDETSAGFPDKLLRNIDRDVEARVRKLGQPVVFWTASSSAEFAACLTIAHSQDRFGRKKRPGEVAIMTDDPHRLAYWLALRPGSES